jgi:mercuric ion transport protein
VACANAGICARPLPDRIVKVSLIVATIVVTGAVAFDILAPLFL